MFRRIVDALRRAARSATGGRSVRKALRGLLAERAGTAGVADDAVIDAEEVRGEVPLRAPSGPAPRPRDPDERARKAEIERLVAERRAAPARRPEPPDAGPLTVRAEPTPNPNAMKFTASRPVVEKGSLSFTSAAAAAAHPLGRALFALDGVRIVFAVNDFVTVTKHDTARWVDLAPRVEAALLGALSG